MSVNRMLPENPTIEHQFYQVKGTPSYPTHTPKGERRSVHSTQVRAHESGSAIWLVPAGPSRCGPGASSAAGPITRPPRYGDSARPALARCPGDPGALARPRLHPGTESRGCAPIPDPDPRDE